MSAPPTRHGQPTPLHQRSNSQNDKPGIRIVPYTPPRLDPDERTPSQASSRDNASSRRSGTYDNQISSSAGHAKRSSWRAEVTESHAGRPGPALASPTTSGFSLARPRDGRVSGVKPVASPSSSGPAGPTTHRLRSPSDVSTHVTAVDASSSSALRSRLEHSPSPVSATSQRPRPLSRRRNFIAVNSDNKTFSLVRDVPPPNVSGSLTGSLTSPPLSYASRSPSAQDRSSSDVWSDGCASTPSTGASTVIPDQSFSELPSFTPPSRASSTTPLADDRITSSPSSYHIVGGLRKVPKSPETEPKQRPHDTPASASETVLAPLPEAAAAEDEEGTPTRTVVPKASFASAASDQTIDTVSESTNYKVYGPVSTAQQSSDSLVFNSASPSNWEALGQSSPPSAFPSSPPAVPHANDENYILHGAPSVSPSSSLVTVSRKPRSTYSQESLVVAPLRPIKKKSQERFGYYKQRSRETLRSRTGSVQSLRSISSIITSQDPSQAFLTAPVLLNLTPSTTRVARGGEAGGASQRFPWSAPRAPGSSSSNAPSAITHRPPPPMIQAHPHQWSSQLSTVMSESEGGSDGDPARSVSPLSDDSGHHRRRSSAGWVSSMHSRQMPSISSSLAGQLEEATATSAGDSLHRPQQSYSRAGPSQIRLVRDQDEHGDGLTELGHQPSRTGLSGFFSNGSSRNIHSSSSSRANSFTSSIPAWARVYYGSGERRWLGRSASFLTVSDSGSSRPASAALPGSESPNVDNFPQVIYSPRKRPREVRPNSSRRPVSKRASMEIAPAPPAQDYRVFRSLKQKTSSIWSPHLQPDRRASRYSVWDPPSVTWSTDSGVLGKRNAQVLLFILGFIFPLAWIIAALLPLPRRPQMIEDNSPSRWHHQYLVDEARYESARWWRNLNRLMSVVGLLIIGAVVALAVVGVRHQWAVR
ncbi:hypothetical protein VTK56DRAFT_8589 [Thermocarpiscus australiensis]